MPVHDRDRNVEAAHDPTYPLAAETFNLYANDDDDDDLVSPTGAADDERRALEASGRSSRSPHRVAESSAGAAAAPVRRPAPPSPSRYTAVPLSDDDDNDGNEGGKEDSERRAPLRSQPRAGLPSYPAVNDDRPASRSLAQPAFLHPGSAAGSSAAAAASAATSSPSSSSGHSTPSRTADRRPLPQARDGVFANLSAKPVPSSEEAVKEEDVPPPYENAAADPTPPYFDTTVITTGATDDEILVEGLPVGSGFIFIWNLLISMSFQFAGFLLTYLLHSSHAGKNGSRAGLGITLIQYGFYLRSQTYSDSSYSYGGNAHEVEDEVSPRAEMLSYIIMVLGWFITIRSTSEYVRARKMAAIIAYHPETVVV